jgi:hypothetical protein
MKPFNFFIAILYPVNLLISQNSAKSLEIGNKWIYFNLQVNYPHQFYLSYEVIKDTIIDQKLYSIIKSNSNSHIIYDYQRADSIKIYRYITSGLNPLREDTLVDFSIGIGDSLGGYVVKEKFTDTYFGSDRLIIHMSLDRISLIHDDVYYVKGMGIMPDVYGGHAIANEISTELKAALIEGVIYGDSALVNVVKKDQFSPSEFMLYQNYPNPFNPNTTNRVLYS